MSDDENENRSLNPGSKKPFRDLKTGEVVMRFRGRAGYVPMEEGGDEPRPAIKANGKASGNIANKNDSIIDLVKLAIRTLELALQIEKK